MQLTKAYEAGTSCNQVVIYSATYVHSYVLLKRLIHRQGILASCYLLLGAVRSWVHSSFYCRQIDICNAQLRVDADNCGKGMFQIITPNSTHCLQAQNKEAMQYWLDQLQVSSWLERLNVQSNDVILCVLCVLCACLVCVVYVVCLCLCLCLCRCAYMFVRTACVFGKCDNVSVSICTCRLPHMYTLHMSMHTHVHRHTHILALYTHILVLYTHI